MRIALTGASGFLGGHVLRAALAAKHEVRAAVRTAAAADRVRQAGAQAALARLRDAELRPSFDGAQAVVHLAHIGAEREGQTYAEVNVAGTAEVAAAARAVGVPRVVMMSGLGVARYGQAPRVTNPYFRSKREAEDVLFGSGLEAVVFRPSYVLGAGDGFVPLLLRQMHAGRVELPGDGSYRMQPVAVEDAAAAILAAADPGRDGLFLAGRARHRVVDLVGPEPLSVRALVERAHACAAELGVDPVFEVCPVAIGEADAAAAAGGWQGMAPDELDCLLCDEVADPAPLEAFLGRPLDPVAEALRRAVRSALAAES